MKCPNCNAELPNQAKFCSFCGKQMNAEIDCPKCGAKFPKGTVFCMECGTKLTSDKNGTISESTSNKFQSKSTVTNDSIRLSLQTGKATLFGTNTFGTFAISPTGVSFTASFTLSSKDVNHSYGFGDIKSTEFKMTHAGLQPYFGYIVSLKNGTIYNYVYSPAQKSHLEKIDRIIKNKI